ncbi:MAG: regulatory protein RecX [Gemmatirosa sp.]
MRARKRVEQPEEVAPIVGVVTGIAAVPRRPGRFEVAVDGKTAAVVSVDIVDRLGLRIGVALDDRAGRMLADAAAELATYDRAIGLLAVQGRSARDLSRRLKQRGEPQAHIDVAITRLTEAGLLDDASYARQVARSRVNGRGDSRRRVSQVLQQKGVARDVVDEAVAEVFADESVDEEALAEASARKKLRGLTGEDVATRQRRLYGYLARRGHDSDVIRRVMARVLGAAGADADGPDDEELDDGEA